MLNELKNRNDLRVGQLQTIDRLKSKKQFGLFYSMGVGKTIIILTLIRDFLDNFSISRVLVVAPPRVANYVWSDEIEKWEHIKHTKICTLSLFSKKKRFEEIEKNYEIFTISSHSVDWIVDNFEQNWKFDCIIFDESSQFKNHSSKRFKKIKRVIKKTEYRYILTGTPNPKSFLDLWSQIYLLDFGDRLGRTITEYRNRYFDRGYNFYVYNLKRDCENKIKNLISDIATSKYTNENDLPKKNEIIHKINFDNEIIEKYKYFKKNKILELNDNEIKNEHGVVIKLQQFCSGALYNENDYEIIHNEKLQLLQNILDDNPNENFLIAYQFIFEKEIITNKMKFVKTLSKNNSELNLWNEKKIRTLLVHPSSIGHGLNLQFGGRNIIWYSLTWDLESYLQFNSRLVRFGQNRSVNIHHFICNNTIEQKIYNRLKHKNNSQSNLMKYLLEK